MMFINSDSNQHHESSSSPSPLAPLAPPSSSSKDNKKSLSSHFASFKRQYWGGPSKRFQSTMIRKRGSSDTLLPTTYSTCATAADANDADANGGDNDDEGTSMSTNIHNNKSSTLHQRNVTAASPKPTVKMMNRKSQLSTRHQQNQQATTATATTPSKVMAMATNNNSFLLGGNYYPGKDKKRGQNNNRHFSRRQQPPLFRTLKTLCYYVFLLYVCINHFMLPLGEWLFVSDHKPFHWRMFVDRYNGSGRSFPTGVRTDILKSIQYDTSLQFLSLREEEIALRHVESERSRLQLFENRHASSNRQRNNILELIAPQWYHRYDVDVDVDFGKKKEVLLQQKDRVQSKKRKRINKKHRSKVPPPPIPNLSKEEEEEEENDVNHTEKKKMLNNTRVNTDHKHQRILTVIGDANTPIRTIHSTGKEHTTTTTSSCPSPTTITTTTTTDGIQVTLVVQTSTDRLWLLEETCRRWTSHIVVVVFIPHGSEENNTNNNNTDSLLDDCNNPNIRILHYQATVEESHVENYPVNKLRNIGLDNVQTSHVMVMDVDFVPSQDLDRQIADALSKIIQETGTTTTNANTNTTTTTALVVPAFERKPPIECLTEDDCSKYLKSDTNFIPHTFEELRECYNDKHCVVFQSENNWDGHSTTQSDKWLDRQWYDDPTDTASFRSIPCFHTARYEPYVVLEWCGSGITTTTTLDKTTKNVPPLSPYYDERFHGYGKNKIELISHLRKSGTQFKVLPEGFIVHNPHPESTVKQTWNDRDGDESKLHDSMDALYKTFLKELDVVYEHVHGRTIKLCKNRL
jgi:hypothetical protein